MIGNGRNDGPIPGAPSWVHEFLSRVDDRFDTLVDRLEVAVADLQLASNEYKPFRDRVIELEQWRAKAESDIAELRTSVRRSITPPGGFAATIPAPGGPPDEAA